MHENIGGCERVLNRFMLLYCFQQQRRKINENNTFSGWQFNVSVEVNSYNLTNVVLMFYTRK